MKNFKQFTKQKFSWWYLVLFGGFFALIGIYIIFFTLASDINDLMSGEIVTASGKSIVRVYGENRYETAVGISKKAFPDPSVINTVVIASGENWPDATAASPLAAGLRAPLILTTSSYLNPVTKNEIVRLQPTRIIIIGGTTAISQGVETEIRNALTGETVERIFGPDRYSTSLLIAGRIKSIRGNITDGTAIFVTGANFPDAISAGAVSAYKKYPIIYTGSSISSSTLSAINNLGIRRSIVVGGTSAVPDIVKNTLPGAIRISGADRYQTSINLASWATSNISGISFTNLGVATGRDYPDALTSSVLMSSLTAPGLTLLTDYQMPSTVYNFISSKKASISHIYVFGGTAAVSTTTFMNLANLMGAQFTSKQILAQNEVDKYINYCPLLAGTVAEISENTSGHQAIVYYKSGRIVINPNHTANLQRIVAHEVYHIYDWRDNNVINWGEYLPPSPKPSCMP